MRTLEGVLLWVSIASYLISFFFFLGGTVFKSDKQARYGWKAVQAAFFLQTLTIVVRWIESGHPPVLGTFEHALAGSWIITLIYVSIGIFSPQARIIGLLAAPFLMLMLGYGVMSKEMEALPLPPPYQSNWLWVHVTFAWIAYGAYHLSAAGGILYLLKEWKLRKGDERLPWILRKVPDLPTLDELISRLVIYGFVAHIIMLGSGAIWAYGLWGRYWAWDPIETWSLISWVIYGINIHMRVTYGWNGRKGAWLAAGSLAAVIITFGGIGFIGGVHTPLL